MGRAVEPRQERPAAFGGDVQDVETFSGIAAYAVVSDGFRTAVAEPPAPRDPKGFIDGTFFSLRVAQRICCAGAAFLPVRDAVKPFLREAVLRDVSNPVASRCNVLPTVGMELHPAARKRRFDVERMYASPGIATGCFLKACENAGRCAFGLNRCARSQENRERAQQQKAMTDHGGPSDSSRKSSRLAWKRLCRA